jgi:uncharacterized membrane protein
MIPAVILLGLANGCRTMMPIAVLCWFAWSGALPLGGTWGFWTAKLVTAIVFTAMAAGELIGDKLPQTPNRTDAFPLAARFLFGGTVGALLATSLHASLPIAATLGAFAALAGAFLGFHIRRWLTKERKLRDFPVAVAEDAIVILASYVALHVATMK